MEYLKGYTIQDFPSYFDKRPKVHYDDIIPQHSNFYFMGLFKNGVPKSTLDRSASSQSRSTSSSSHYHNHVNNKLSVANSSLILSDSCPIHSPYGSSRTLSCHGLGSKSLSNSMNTLNLDKRSYFSQVSRLDDELAIRAAQFHPRGKVYAVGSNSKTLRICEYPKSCQLENFPKDHKPNSTTVLVKKANHHRGSIYCVGWNASGDLLATGSNDKTVKLMRFDADQCKFVGSEVELTMHDGTVRDVCFMEDLSNGSSLLISAGAGDCKVYITDCETATPFAALAGHKGHILSLYTWGGAMFASGSLDRTIRFWDLRTRGCVNVVPAASSSKSISGSGVTAVCVDPSGRLLVSGHEDSNIMLYDIRGNRMIQSIRSHTSEVRTVRFSSKAYYLLTGSYDNKVILTDLQGDLTQPVPGLIVAEHKDKVVQACWHPNDFTFLTTSADRTAILWKMLN